MLGSHMMFNLREAAERGVNVGTSCWTVGADDTSERPTLTDMDFALGKEAPRGLSTTMMDEQVESIGAVEEKGKMREDA